MGFIVGEKVGDKIEILIRLLEKGKWASKIMTQMNLLLIEIIGFFLLAFSLKELLKMRTIDPISILQFEDSTHEIEFKNTGYYSISVLGAGSVNEIKSASIKVASRDNKVLDLTANKIAPRFTKENQIGIECWGFSVTNVGKYDITLTNLKHIEAKKSILGSKRLFELPIEHVKLRILIHQSIQPVKKLFFIFTLIISVILIFSGIFQI